MAAYMNKVVMVTGAAGGIGRALSLAYGEQGAFVVIADKNREGLKETESLLRAGGCGCTAYELDLANAEAIAELFRRLQQSAGRLDVLLNNAGLGVWKSPYELAVDEWDYVLNTNLRGTFLCAREAAALMKQHGGGAIVNIASTRAFMSESGSEAYAASKGGIVALTHALAVSLGPDGITVNAVSPGWIETGDYEALRDADHSQHPAGRVGRPEDIVRGCLYLTDPRNDFVTGMNLTIDGGMTKKMIYAE